MNPWWVEEVGDTPPQPKGLDVRQAKRMLFVVLRHYGARIGPTIVSSSTMENRWLSMRCPFHQDSHPSASVNFRVNKFKCHSCDVHGDAIDIVMGKECLSFKDALTWITELNTRWSRSGNQKTDSTSTGSEEEV